MAWAEKIHCRGPAWKLEIGGIKEKNVMLATEIQFSPSMAFQRGPFTAHVKQILTQIV